METIELYIDDTNIEDGIDAISFVNSPAIEENFVALSKHKVEFKSIDDEKRIIVGLALVPDKEIYRRQGDKEFNIIFSKETVKKASHLYLKKLKVNNTTLEHEKNTDGVSVVESWIIEDVKNDKSNVYGLNAVEGAWAVVMKVDNDKVWNDVKDGKYLGLSIEGIFSDKKEDLQKTELQSYTDYPQAATNNAKRALEWAEKNGWGSCGESTGKNRANQLAKREPISRDTIARMASFKRHQQNKDVPYSEGCGGLMWDAWGGTAGINWASRKLKEIDLSKDVEDMTDDEALELLNTIKKLCTDESNFL